MSPLRVLVVDDCHDTVDSMVLMLPMWGYDGIAAYDGASALDLARQQRPDLALLDVAMPREQDGYALARQLRQEVALLVAVTGYADGEHRRRCEEAGFDLVVPKPFEPARLQALLEEAAKLRRETEQVTARTAELIQQAKRRCAELRAAWERAPSPDGD